MVNAIFKIPEENQKYIIDHRSDFADFRRSSFDDFFEEDKVIIPNSNESIKDGYCRRYIENPSSDFDCLITEKKLGLKRVV